MFDLSTVDTDGIRIHLKRERLFETNWNVSQPRPCNHEGVEWWAGAYGGARRDKYEAKYVRKGGYVPRDKTVVMALMGIEHPMTWRGLFEALPPAYTEYIGTELLKALQ
jgi:DNA (cytosine-5)-methyltransferase 1